MILQIKLHAISKKILQKELLSKDGSLILDRSNLYYDHLMLKRIPLNRYSKKTDNLTEYISIEVSGRSMHVSNHIGYYLYKLHKDECYRYMYAYVEGGGNAMDGLKSWCRRYGIDDDDIDMSSLYRMFNRYTHKKGYMYNIRSVKKKSEFYSIEDIRWIYWSLVSDMIDEMYYYNEKPISCMYRYIYMMLLYDLGKCDVKYIAGVMGVKGVTVYKGISKAKDFIRQVGGDQMLARLVG